MIRLFRLIGRNKYKIMFAGFFVWIMFFDEANVSLWVEKRNINKNIEKEIKNFKRRTLETERQINALRTSGDSIEKFAREYFLMKFENEDIYLFN